MTKRSVNLFILLIILSLSTLVLADNHTEETDVIGEVNKASKLKTGLSV